MQHHASEDQQEPEQQEPDDCHSQRLPLGLTNDSRPPQIYQRCLCLAVRRWQQPQARRYSNELMKHSDPHGRYAGRESSIRNSIVHTL